MVWQQVYDPFSNIWLSAVIAFLPILCFLLCLLVFKLKGYLAGFITVVFASILALFAYDMPFSLIGASFVQGFAQGMWPIAWIIIAAIFLYKLSIKSGSFEIIKQSVMSITPDHRIQVILIGFCFGSFLEGAIGFGGPVAITAALLVGLGLKPLYAAGLCLIANTAPVAFGAVGIPIIAMANLVQVEQKEVAAMVGRMLVPLSLTVPFFIVFLMDGIKGVKETFPAILVAAVTFTGTQFLSSNFLGAELPDIASAIVSLACTTIFLKYWKPSNIFRLDDLKEFSNDTQLGFGKVFKAWLPFILLIICIVIWTQPWFKALFAKGGILDYTQITIAATNINASIIDPDGKAIGLSQGISFVGLQAGTAILLAAFLTIWFLKIKANEAADCFWDTLKEMAIPCITIGLVVSFAFVSKNSGMSATLGQAFAKTGDAFSFFSPIIGWIGVFLTGSDTSANLLFGPLQQVTAKELGVGEALFLAANSVGGVVGKMISPQSIAIACAAVGLVGRESDLFRFTLKYSVAFILLIGIWTCIIAFFMGGIIPETIPLTK
ncbi:MULTISPECIES: lactate permease LctP family transporter [unclassified Campylobacter]|uniref:lactate permease LctP family transporter n=1 Tax=unclassified Campylobacter TaxID=2593542 RepID=UPI001237E782|nr:MULTISPECIES: lactate permease LctP family transporter [unclassified Campylobacter]KAA6225036.1 L-lactate permease [Campylobacter sp. LR185c]KAA6225995.1 L-lactate permease [Campylobacter sp. LR196d]KAA6226060.1 L-lactate permease [Campylobacter sp. LR286c]KAA6230365.1 L-lactate permease [Campylobacter sp. LR264d]KAA8603365.1 L-lactate permease [Campylobacter sp. LR185c]